MNLEVKQGEHLESEQCEQLGLSPRTSVRRIIDVSLELDETKFRMRTYEGFTKDMQFELEVIKEYPGGLGQIVRGAHMRLHAGTHVDAPSHMVQGGKQIHDANIVATMLRYGVLALLTCNPEDFLRFKTLITIEVP